MNGITFDLKFTCKDRKYIIAIQHVGQNFFHLFQKKETGTKKFIQVNSEITATEIYYAKHSIRSLFT